MASRTESLFHYTESLENLKTILSSSFFWPKYCSEELSWFSESKVNQEQVLEIAHPMVCFCDIPISRADEHTERYGAFGIGMKRRWVESKNISPVTYVAKRDSKLTSTLNHIISAATKNFNDRELDYMRFFMAHIKPIRGQENKKQGKRITVDFYKEAEWRHVASGKGVKPYLLKNIYEDSKKRSHHDENVKNTAPLTFSFEDISYLLVKSESDVLELVNFIQKDLRDKIEPKVRSLLLTKIYALENFKKDV